ncbi:MAG: hypothetical protein QM652_11710, partial [Legionella sp.]|uniref:hypothetical protein n=1 Tax=Legionella sp. TaxID=459 RepID=UPI0039E3696E
KNEVSNQQKALVQIQSEKSELLDVNNGLTEKIKILNTKSNEFEKKIHGLEQQAMKATSSKILKKEDNSEKFAPSINEITKNLEELEGLREKINSLNKVNTQLKDLSKIPVVGLNPAFQESAKAEAITLEPHLRKLVDSAKILASDLNNQSSVIKKRLSDLSSDNQLADSNYKQKVEIYRQELISYLRIIEDELRIHTSMQGWVQGNKENQGMFQTLKQAREGLKDLRQVSTTFRISYTDYPMAEKSKYLGGSETKGLGASLTVSKPNGTSAPYEMVNRVAPNYFREHTVDIKDKVVGRFIEERITNEAAPKTKLTVTSFPPATDPNGRVVYSMAMVTQLLAGLKEPPSAKNPIILSGENAEQLEYLWTAVKVIGENTPHMKFDLDAIVIKSSKFDPKKEIEEGTEKFSADSCYKKNFDPDLVKGLLNDVSKLAVDKFGHKSEQAVNSFNDMKKALKDMKHENQENIKESDQPKPLLKN